MCRTLVQTPWNCRTLFRTLFWMLFNDFSESYTRLEWPSIISMRKPATLLDIGWEMVRSSYCGRTATWQGLRAARITQESFTHRHPGQPLTHRRSVTHAPPHPGTAQILHQNTKGDLECVSGGAHQADSRHPSVFWWRIWAGPGGGGAWVTERRWVKGCQGCLCVSFYCVILAGLTSALVKVCV